MNTEIILSAAELTSPELTTVAETAVAEDHGIGFTPEGLEWSLPIMGKGMLGIFIVMGIVIGCVSLLNNVSGPKKKKEKKQ